MSTIIGHISLEAPSTDVAFLRKQSKKAPQRITSPTGRLLSSILLSGLLLLLCSLPLQAQQLSTFTIQDFRLDQLDQAAKTGPFAKSDDNGHLFAIVKVRTPNDDDLRRYAFSFGLKESFDVVRDYDGQRWLYVEQGAKNITVSRPNYKTVQQPLPLTTKAGHVYELWIMAEATQMFMQVLQFNISPADAQATVMVGGEKFGDADRNGQVAKSLALGVYEYQVAAENYHTSTGRVTLDQANTTLVENVVLRPNFGTVTLAVDADADIYVNNELRGRRQWSGTLKAGTYSVECRQERHRPSRQNITVEENDSRTFRLTPPEPVTGTLQITSAPLGASVVVDGRERGVTPLTLTDLIIGRHDVVLRLHNYKDEQRTVEVLDRQTVPLEVALSDIARMTIRSHPDGAQLAIDGQPVGTTPYEADMPSGDYTLRLARRGWRSYERQHHLSSSHPELTLHMRRQLQQPTSGYVQAAVQAGSLMAAGATVGIYINNVNIEASYLVGLATSDDIYWNATSGDQRPVVCQYKPSAIGAKVGYGIIAGTALRLTPQVGATIVSVKADASKTHVVSAAAGLRADYAVTKGVGLFVAPELDFAVKKGDIYTQLEPLSSKIKGWGSGFNVRAGLCLFF